MRKAALILSIIVLCVLLATGCSRYVDEDSYNADAMQPVISEEPLTFTEEPIEDESSNGSNEPCTPQPAALIPPTYSDSRTRAAAHGANDFAFRLSAALAQNIEYENLVVSPFSVWLPLAALINATDMAYRPALLEALGAAGINIDDANSHINHAASRMLFNLTNQDGRRYAREFGFEYHNPLQIANAVFIDNDTHIRQDFAQAFMDYYRGTVMNVDFSSPDAVHTVNTWASYHTNGLITNIVQDFNPNTVAAIANAIYFADRWSWEFNPDYTTQGIFYSPIGELEAYFMQREGDQLYYEDDYIQAIHLSFRTGGGMQILLPKSGCAVELLSSMTMERFGEIMTGSQLSDGKLLLPRFSIESRFNDLADTLTALGVPLFDKAAEPLTGGLIYEDIPLWLSGAVQMAVIEVDEQGTTAAAVTIMDIFGAAPALPAEPFVMICNRPFVFILYGFTNDGGRQVLFTGVVNQP